jgi:hypothetical protein
MADIFRTLIIPTAQVQLARDIAAALDPSGAGMWTTGCSPDGSEPATHFISSGWIPPGWQVMVPTQFWRYLNEQWVKTGETPGDPVLVWQQATAAGMIVTQAEIDALFAVADVTEQEPQMAMARLGIQVVTPPEPEPTE